MPKTKTTLALAMAAFFAATVLAGCNTTAGAGRDMQKAGEKLEESAQKHGAD